MDISRNEHKKLCVLKKASHVSPYFFLRVLICFQNFVFWAYPQLSVHYGKKRSAAELTPQYAKTSFNSIKLIKFNVCAQQSDTEPKPVCHFDLVLAGSDPNYIAFR